MAQFSGFWTTGGTDGDQVAGYTQAHLSTAMEIIAACNGFEGVAPGYGNGLEVTATDDNEVTVNTGAALVDGKWFENTAGVTVNIPSASGGGNTRIDRIVLRCVWGDFEVAIHRIAGTDAGTPTPPAITQTSGTTYDIQLAQVLVDTTGNCVVTDERIFAGVQIDDVTLEVNSDGELQVKDRGLALGKLENQAAVSILARWANSVGVVSTLAAGENSVLRRQTGNLAFGKVLTSLIEDGAVTENKIGAGAVTADKIGTGAVTKNKIGAGTVTADKIGTGAVTESKIGTGAVTGNKIGSAAVDDTKVGNRVPQFYRRQGDSSSNNWTVQGSITRTPTTVRMQAGAIQWTGTSANNGSIVVTFPTAFQHQPLVFLSTNNSLVNLAYLVNSNNGTNFNAVWRTIDGSNTTSVEIYWLAIGPY